LRPNPSLTVIPFAWPGQGRDASEAFSPKRFNAMNEPLRWGEVDVIEEAVNIELEFLPDAFKVVPRAPTHRTLLRPQTQLPLFDAFSIASAAVQSEMHHLAEIGKITGITVCDGIVVPR